jgi:hypothetical protein
MIDGTAPSTAEVQDLVDEWFHCLDVHAPVERLRAMLADDGLEMKFPEKTLRSLEEFGQWYDTVTRQYFDEVHTLEPIAVRQEGPDAIASIRVRWEASVWNPPDAKSQRLAYDADQTWRLRRVQPGQRVVITTYIVDALTPVSESREA